MADPLPYPLYGGETIDPDIIDFNDIEIPLRDKTEAGNAQHKKVIGADLKASFLGTIPDDVAEFSSRIEAVESTAEQAASVASVANFGITSLSYETLSGSPFRTTGAISSGSNVLTVASSETFAAGQGIYIAGAGAGGAPLIATITDISGNTITIDTAAETTVSDIMVQHDDTDALNELLADLFATGGNFARIKSGHYRCNKWSAEYNSILKIPREENYTLLPRRVKIIGEQRGYMKPDMTGAETGGVVIDCTNAPAPTGDLPAAFAAAPFVEAPSFNNIYTQWNNVHVQLDNFLLLLPPNPQFAGVNLWNTTGADIGDGVTVVAASPVAGSSLLVPGFAEPTNPKAKGIILPAYLNNIYVNLGACIVMGFYDGLVVTEHCFMRRPSISWCKNGMRLATAGHMIEGHICIENCNRTIVTGDFGSSGGSASNVDFSLQYELNGTGGKWWSPNSTGALIYDPANRMRGRLTVSGYDMANGGSGLLTGRVTGAAWLHVHNIRDLHSLFIMRRFAASGFAQLVWQTSTTSQWEISMRGSSDALSFYNYQGGGTLGGSIPMSIGKSDGAVNINNLRAKINRPSGGYAQLVWQTEGVSQWEISLLPGTGDNFVVYNHQGSGTLGGTRPLEISSSDGSVTINNLRASVSRADSASSAPIVWKTGGVANWEIAMRSDTGDNLVIYNHAGTGTLGGTTPFSVAPDGSVTINHLKGRINRAGATDFGQLIWQTNSVSKHEISMRGDGTEDLIHYNYTTGQWDWRWKDSEIQSRLPILFSTADAVVRTRNSLGINVVDGAWVPVVGSLADKTFTVFKNTQSTGPMAGKVYLVARYGEQLYGVEMPPFPPES